MKRPNLEALIAMYEQQRYKRGIGFWNDNPHVKDVCLGCSEHLMKHKIMHVDGSDAINMLSIRLVCPDYVNKYQHNYVSFSETSLLI